MVERQTAVRRRQGFCHPGRPRALRADAVPAACRRRRRAMAVHSQYRTRARSVAHHDADRQSAAADGASARARARHPSGRCGAARSRRRRSCPHREPAWREHDAGASFRRSAPGRSFCADALDRPVHLGGTDRRPRRGGDRSDFRAAGAESYARSRHGGRGRIGTGFCCAAPNTCRPGLITGRVSRSSADMPSR